MEKTRKKSSLWVWIIVILVILAGAGYLLSQNSANADVEDSPLPAGDVSIISPQIVSVTDGVDQVTNAQELNYSITVNYEELFKKIQGGSGVAYSDAGLLSWRQKNPNYHFYIQGWLARGVEKTSTSTKLETGSNFFAELPVPTKANTKTSTFTYKVTAPWDVTLKGNKLNGFVRITGKTCNNIFRGYCANSSNVTGKVIAQAKDTDYFTAPAVDLSIKSITVDKGDSNKIQPNAKPGDIITYTIKYANYGSSDAANVSFHFSIDGASGYNFAATNTPMVLLAAQGLTQRSNGYQGYDLIVPTVKANSTGTLQLKAQIMSTDRFNYPATPAGSGISVRLNGGITTQDTNYDNNWINFLPLSEQPLVYILATSASTNASPTPGGTASDVVPTPTAGSTGTCTIDSSGNQVCS